jgi:hypothetical protein
LETPAISGARPGGERTALTTAVYTLPMTISAHPRPHSSACVDSRRKGGKPPDLDRLEYEFGDFSIGPCIYDEIGHDIVRLEVVQRNRPDAIDVVVEANEVTEVVVEYPSDRVDGVRDNSTSVPCSSRGYRDCWSGKEVLFGE